MVATSIEINKIPLGAKPFERSQVFPRMPALYLELLENKQKTKQDFINTEYIHKYSSSEEYPPESIEIDSEYSSSEDGSVYNGSDIDDVEDFKHNESSELFQNKDEIEDDDITNDGNDSDDEDKESLNNDDLGSINSMNSTLSGKMNELLEDSEEEPSVTNVKRKRKDKYNKHRDRSGHSISKRNKAPTLAELAAAGSFIPKSELRDINSIPVSDKHYDDMKRELLFKFELLRKSYPSASIPEYTIHTDYNAMLNSYEDCVRRLSLDSSVENYKQYLIYGFMGIEFLFGKFLKLDMEGFTQQQILSMSSYEKLLIELGEKSYIPEGSKWSVELRLLFLVIMNSAFFIVSKMIMKKTSIDLMNMMNGVSMSFNSKPDKGEEKPKRNMKGPDIDLDEL